MKSRQRTKRKADGPDSLTALADEYLEWLEINNYSAMTVKGRRRFLSSFITWCEDRGILRYTEVTRPIIERYKKHLFYHRKENGSPLTFRTQHSLLVPVRMLFKWCARQNYIMHNPAADVILPKPEKRLPRHVLTPNEAEQVLIQADVDDPLGIRDRAIMETLYSTGIRRSELCNLSVYDVDRNQGTVMIRQGKGGKDRVVPIGDRALAWIDKYISDIRPYLVTEPDCGSLFLNNQGQKLAPDYLTNLIGHYVKQANINKQGACHLFRHTMATAMLENGADIRFIQQMLGHADLSTTQIYTHVSIKKLKQIHTLTHPARPKPPTGRQTKQDQPPHTNFFP